MSLLDTDRTVLLLRTQHPTMSSPSTKDDITTTQGKWQLRQAEKSRRTIRPFHPFLRV